METRQVPFWTDCLQGPTVPSFQVMSNNGLGLRLCCVLPPESATTTPTTHTDPLPAGRERLLVRERAPSTDRVQ